MNKKAPIKALIIFSKVNNLPKMYQCNNKHNNKYKKHNGAAKSNFIQLRINAF